MNTLLFKALIMFSLALGLTGTDTPPADTPLEQQWQSAYAVSAQRMLGVVQETEEILQMQEAALMQSEGEMPGPAEDAFAHMKGYLNQVRQDLEEGTVPLTFRARTNANRPEDAQEQPNNEPGAGCGEECEPVGDENHYGQEEDNDGQNGDGDCDGDCEPIGDENQNGQEEADDNGENGDGDCDCDGDCDPSGDENQNGGDDDNGQNGGDGDCDNDCVPTGDENHNRNGGNEGE